MAYQPVENLIVWRRSKDLAVAIYKLTANWTDFDLKSRMRRASVSIPSNIAEGYERGSSSEKRHFYRISRGSASELRTRLIIALEAEVIDKAFADAAIPETREIAAMIQGLINSLPE